MGEPALKAFPFALAIALTVHVPALASAAPCTFVTSLYVCEEEGADGEDCASEGATGAAFTSVGAGVGGVAGVSAGGAQWCSASSSSQYVTVGAGAGPAFVSVGWTEGSGGGNHQCILWVYAFPAPMQIVTCPGETPPPNPGWGHVLP